jgi:hypothetical protein
MSCDNWTYCNAIVDLVPRASLTVEVGDYAPRETNLEPDKSQKQGRSGLTAKSKSQGYRHEVQSRVIPDSTQTDPVYVWGDEGPIND